jgi:hypothetical protein
MAVELKNTLHASVALNVDLQADAAHPNKMHFKGVLTRLDEPSSKPPNGADGHKILVTTEVAEKRLSTLVGMGVNYTPELNAHAQKRKVGVIEKAWIDGKDLCVSGIIWKHDFPEAKTDLKQDALGMSMEIGEVHVDDVSAQVWELSDFYFLGATILFKNAAAYSKTHLIAAKADERNNMTKKTTTNKSGKTADVTIAKIAASQEKIIEFLSRQNDTIAALSTRLDNIEITSAGKEADMDADDDVDAEALAGLVKAAKKKAPAEDDSTDEDDDEEDDEEDDDDMDSASEDINKGSLEELGSTLDPDDTDDDDPGHFNKDAKNYGSDTTTMDKLGKTVESSRILNLSRHVARLQKELKASQLENKKLSKKMTRIDSQMSAAADRTDRRSFPAEIVGLLAKSNLDPREISASGQKLTPVEVDAVFAAAGVQLDVTKRIALKSELAKRGLMDEGVVDRGYGMSR